MLNTTATLVRNAQNLTDTIQTHILTFWNTPLGKTTITAILTIGIISIIYFLIKKLTKQQIIDTATTSAAILLACVIAGVGATLAGSNMLVFALAAAVLAAYTGLSHSMQNAGTLFLGTVFGLLAGQIIVHMFGWSLVTAMGAIATGLLIGVILRLDTDSTRGLAVTALFGAALGMATGDQLIVDRAIAVIIGASAGILVALLPWPNNALKQARKEMTNLRQNVGNLLADLSLTMATPVSITSSTALLDRSRQLLEKSNEVEQLVEEARTNARLSPFISAPDTVGKLVIDWTKLEHAVESVNTVCRDVHDAVIAGHKMWPTSVSLTLGEVSELFTVETTTKEMQPIKVSQSVADIRNVEDTGVLLLQSSVLNQAKRLGTTATTTPDAVASDAKKVEDVIPFLFHHSK